MSSDPPQNHRSWPAVPPVGPSDPGTPAAEDLERGRTAEPAVPRSTSGPPSAGNTEPEPEEMALGDQQGSPRGSSPAGGVRAILAAGLRAAEGSRSIPWAKRLAIAGKVATLAGAIAFLGATVAVLLTIRHYEAQVPSVAQLRKGYAPPQVTRVLARDGTLLANIFTERRTVVSFDAVPGPAKLAFLAAEDAHFYEHEGLNYIGMLRALLVNLRAGHTVQGGSTITQQVVKNILLDAERSYERKLKEVILARRLEQNLTKHEIFSLYLNHIYFGHGRYGVEEASRYYFGKPTETLTLAEAALLAGIVAAPERYSPRNSPERALARRSYVLDQMRVKGFVTPELHRESNRAPLRLAPAVEAESELAPEVVAYAKRTLEKLVGAAARTGGFSVTTTIDPAWQAEARQAVRRNLDGYARRQKLEPPYTVATRRLWNDPCAGQPKPHRACVGTVRRLDDRTGMIEIQVGDGTGRVAVLEEERFNPQRLPPSKFTKEGAALRVRILPRSAQDEAWPLRLALGPESALVAIDARSREVRALVGSYEALQGGLDRATQTRRQPGSAFKPFVYSYALHARRFAPATILELPAKGGSRAPGDTSGQGIRRVSVRTAVAESDNAAAEHVLLESGAANVVEWAQACGIQSELGADKSLALGSYEVTPLEIANAFATFASGGEYAPARLIRKIVGPGGQELPLPPEAPRRQVMAPEEAYLTTSLLRGVVERGTGRRARSLGRPLAGKTGTTNDAKDAWFVGYSTDVVAAVWVGYDTPAPLGAGEQGAATALPGWIDFMKLAHEGRPAADFPRPPRVALVSIDPATGLLPYEGQEDAVEEEFLADAIPTERAQGVDAGAPEDGGGSGEGSPGEGLSEAEPTEAPPEGEPGPAASQALAAERPGPAGPGPGRAAMSNDPGGGHADAGMQEPPPF